MKHPKTSKKPVAKNQKAPASKPKPAAAAPLTPQSKLETVDISSIIRDDTTQIRAEMSPATVEDYAQVLRNGGRLPPPVVFRDRRGKLWLGDGHHTIAASERVGHTVVECDVRVGSRLDAWSHAVKTNARHGLQLCTADKNKILQTALKIEAWTGLSNRQFAEEIGRVASYETIRKARNRLKPPAEPLESAAEHIASVRRSLGHADKVCQPGKPQQAPAGEALPPAEHVGGAVNLEDGKPERDFINVAKAIGLDHICKVEGGVTLPPYEEAPVELTSTADTPPAATLDAAQSDPSESVIYTLRTQPDMSIACAVGSGIIAVAVRQASGITLYRAQILSKETVAEDGSSDEPREATSAAWAATFNETSA